MKRSIIPIILTVLMVFFVFNNILVQKAEAEGTAVNKGFFTIFSYDSIKHHPIKNTQYNLIDSVSNKVLESITTNSKGIAVSNLYAIGTKFKVVQTKISDPYTADKNSHTVEIKRKTNLMILNSKVKPFIKSYSFNSGSIVINQVSIPVKTVMQKPELPNGCEITSLTAVLNSLNFNVTKTEMSDKYLSKQPFVRKNGKLYGADPNLAFAGDPREESGFFTYAPPIVSAANSYLKTVNGKFHGFDISGSSQDAILNQLKKGTPVVIWITLELQKPKVTYGWYLFNTNKYLSAPVNLHCVVLTGFDASKLYVMDPLKGQVTYDPALFFNSYAALGSHAMVVVPN